MARQIQWAGFNWNVRTGSGGPGPNNWSDSPENVWIDIQGNLHLRITYRNGIWYCAEVYTTQTVGYGTYTFKMVTDPTIYPKNIVAGMFYWYEVGPNLDELDIEFSRWDYDYNLNTQYTVWMNNLTDNVESSMFETAGINTIHNMVWSSDRIYFEGPAGNWTYPGTYRPRIGGVYDINLWIYDPNNIGYKAPADNKEQELILSSFSYTECPTPVSCIFQVQQLV